MRSAVRTTTVGPRDFDDEWPGGGAGPPAGADFSPPAIRVRSPNTCKMASGGDDRGKLACRIPFPTTVDGSRRPPSHTIKSPAPGGIPGSAIWAVGPVVWNVVIQAPSGEMLMISAGEKELGRIRPRGGESAKILETTWWRPEEREGG